MVPSENVADGIKKYKKVLKNSDGLRKSRPKIFTPVEVSSHIQKDKNLKKGKLDISLSSRADECGERVTKTSQEKKQNNSAVKEGNKTVYNKKFRNIGLVISLELLIFYRNNDMKQSEWRTMTNFNPQISKMYPVSPISM